MCPCLGTCLSICRLRCRPVVLKLVMILCGPMCVQVTPCDHIFHARCLQRWMDIKMECPTCRRSLPPL